MTLIVLLLLASLTAAFAMLSATEPQITNNLRQGSEVLALAEAGVEEAVWALSNPTLAEWGTFPAMPPPDRYNFTGAAAPQWIALGAGAYNITIAPGAASNEFTVTANGRTPNVNTATATKRITVTLMSMSLLVDPPAALTVRGQLDIAGNATVDAKVSTCGTKKGVYAAKVTTISENGKVYGGDGNLTPNESTDYTQNTEPTGSPPDPTFTNLAFTPEELNALKALALANGTYYGPGYPPPGSSTYTGTVSFSALPNGIVFVDTISGNPIGNPPNASDLANVTINGGTSSGWVIAMGTLTMTGNTTHTGLVYAANDLVMTGNSTVTGAVMSLNVLDSVRTVVDSTATGRSRITYDCSAIKTGVATGGTGPPTVPQGYFVKPGSWRQVPG